jgi:hypothetical protein
MFARVGEKMGGEKGKGGAVRVFLIRERRREEEGQARDRVCRG